MDWYYSKNNQQLGPVSQETLLSLYSSGEVSASDLVWNETMSEGWKPIGQLAEFSSAAPAAPAPAYGVPNPAPPVIGAVTAAGVSRNLTPAVPNYLWQSIACTVLCCVPLGIPAIVFATKVGPALAIGDLAAAREASSKAKTWCWIAFGLGLLGGLLYLGLVVVAGVSGEL
jgi:Interferon-induced transmembrane protein/GYF domain 2